MISNALFFSFFVIAKKMVQEKKNEEWFDDKKYNFHILVFKIKKPRFLETRAKTIKKEEAKLLPLYLQRMYPLSIFYL